MSKDCCKEFREATAPGSGDGDHAVIRWQCHQWVVEGCCGACNVLHDIRYCPFCGTKLKPNLNRRKNEVPS